MLTSPPSPSLLLVSAAYAQTGGLRFRLTDLEGNFKSKTVPTLSVAYAINTAGQITGDLAYGNSQYCFLYSPGAVGATFTSAAASTLWCDARAINSSGWITGSIYMPNAGVLNAFLRSPSSGKIWNYPSTYANPGGIYYNSYGWGIDDSLNVVGEMDAYYPSNGDIFQIASSWNSTGTPVTVPGYSQAYATSASGAYVALYDTYGSQPPTLWNISYLNPYCGYWDGLNEISVAYAVNNHGNSVGFSVCADFGDSNLHATLWTSPPSYFNENGTDLGFAPSVAYAISNDGWIVGHSLAWSGSVGDAFLRVSDPRCPMLVNLNSLLDGSGTGWKVVRAYGINTVHQIVGQAADSKGRLHAVLLTPDNKQSACVY